MPRATNNIVDTVRVDLKTCPGGFVVLRRLTYGQWLKRQELAMTMQMIKKGDGTQLTDSNMALDIGMDGAAVAHFEFRNCIAEHNLTDENDAPLDFNQAFTVDVLDPRVGQEIGDAIDKLNQFEAELGN